MPTLKEAAVAVSGQIIDVERLSNFDTKAYDGLRVVIATGDGFAQVKLSIEDAESVKPVPQSFVVWFVRYGAWAREGSGNANTSCRYVSPVTEEFLGRANGIIKQKAA